jgi:outer membrane protein assembly factor BamB
VINETYPRRQQISPLGCIGPIIGIAVVMVAGVLFFASAPSSPSTSVLPGINFPTVAIPKPPPDFYPTGDAIVIPPDDAPAGTIAEVAVLVRGRGNDNGYRMAMINPNTNEYRWVSENTLSESAGSYANFAATSDRIFFTDERTLIAFSRADGSRVWETTLSDRICRDCIKIIGNTIVTIGIDYELAAFDLATGERLWSNVNDVFRRNPLRSINDQLLIISEDEESRGQIQVVNPTTGDVERTIMPTCEGTEFGNDQIFFRAYDVNWVDPTSKQIIMSSSYGETCIYSYDLESGERLWQNLIEDSSFNLRTGDGVIQTENELITSTGNQLLALNLNSGAWRLVINEEDYTIYPIASNDGVIATVSVRQRGTSRAELWGIEAESGKRLWRKEFPNDGRMIGGPFQGSGTIDEGESLWTWATTDQGFAIVTLEAQPHQYVVEQINLRNGQSLSKTANPASASPSSIIWVPYLIAREPNRLYLISITSDTLNVLNIATGKLEYEGP